MATPLGDNYKLEKALPDFERQYYETLEAMLAVKKSKFPQMYIATCRETGKVYLFNKDNDPNHPLGLWREIGTGSGSSGTTEAIVSNIEVGGVKAGDEIPEGSDLTTVLKKMLVKYNKPSVTFTATPASKVVKVGNSISPVLTASVVKKSEDIVSVIFYKGQEVIEEVTEVSPGDKAYIHNADAITSDTTYKVKVGDGKEDTESSLSYYFVNPFVYGVRDGKEVTEFSGLTELIEQKGKKAISYTANNKFIVFAYPKSYGVLKSIMDPNNFENISSFTSSTLIVDSVEYYVYVSNSAVTCSNFKYTFSY